MYINCKDKVCGSFDKWHVNLTETKVKLKVEII